MLRHIGSVHSYEPGFQITCGVEGCARTYSNFRSFQKHLTRQHKAVLESDATEDTDTVIDVDLEETSQQDDQENTNLNSEKPSLKYSVISTKRSIE